MFIARCTKSNQTLSIVSYYFAVVIPNIRLTSSTNKCTHKHADQALAPIIIHQMNTYLFVNVKLLHELSLRGIWCVVFWKPVGVRSCCRTYLASWSHGFVNKGAPWTSPARRFTLDQWHLIRRVDRNIDAEDWRVGSLFSRRGWFTLLS